MVENEQSQRRKAAISFLSNIPVNFQSFCESCRGKQPRTSQASELTQYNDPGPDTLRSDLGISDEPKAQTENAVTWAGKRKFSKGSFQVGMLKPRVILQKRIFFVDKVGDIPISIVSVLGYHKEGKLLTSSATTMSIRRRSKLTSNSQGVSTKVQDSQDALRIDGIQVPGEEEEVSYKSLLDSSSRNNLHLNTFTELDNPEWKSGSHRTVLTFPSYIVSVLDYAKPTELKKDLNNRFKEKYPNVNITLSKSRSLKQVIQRVALSQNIDPTAISKSLLYFDYLVMSGKVVKANRRYCAGVCLLLSAKVNSDLKTIEVSKLITAIEHGLRIGRHDLVLFEFPVLAALQFSLIDFPSIHSVQS